MVALLTAIAAAQVEQESSRRNTSMSTLSEIWAQPTA